MPSKTPSGAAKKPAVTEAKQSAIVPNPPQPATAPTPKVDFLRVLLHNLAPNQEEEVKYGLLAMLIDWLGKASTHDLQSLMLFAQILDRDIGFLTPAEEFITDLVMEHGGYSPDRHLTPETAAGALAKFTDNFSEILEGARSFTAQYSDVPSASA